MTLQDLVSIAGGPFTGKGVLLAVRLSRDSKSNCDDGSLVFSKCLLLLLNTVPWRSTFWERGSILLLWQPIPFSTTCHCLLAAVSCALCLWVEAQGARLFLCCKTVLASSSFLWAFLQSHPWSLAVPKLMLYVTVSLCVFQTIFGLVMI